MSRAEFIKHIVNAVVITGCVLVFGLFLKNAPVFASYFTAEGVIVLVLVLTALILLKWVSDGVVGRYHSWKAGLSEVGAIRLQKLVSIVTAIQWMLVGAFFYNLYIHQEYVSLVVLAVFVLTVYASTLNQTSSSDR